MLVHALSGLAGIAGGVAVCLGVFAAMSRNRVAAWFSLISVGLASYAGLQAAIFSTPDPSVVATLLRFQGVATASMMMLLPWFGAAFAGKHEGLFGWVISGSYALLALWSLASPCGYWFDSLDRVDAVVLPWGETIRMPRGTGSWCYLASQVLQYPLYLRLLLRAPILYREGRRSDAWLWGGAMVLLVAAALHDQGVDRGWWSGQYVVEWVFLAMLLVIGVRLGVEIHREYRQRQKTEAALRYSETRLRDISEATIEGIAFTEQGRVVDGNRQLAVMLGYEPQELIGRPVLDFVAPESRAAVADFMRSNSQESYEHMALRKNGTVFPVEARARMSEREGRPVRVTVIRDLSERKQAEEERLQLKEQVQQAMKMEAVGQLAGGVAHDFNNLLQAVIGHAEMVLMDTPSGDPRRADMEEILRTGERAADLTRQLLAFARKQPVQPQVLELNEVVEDMFKMLRRLIGENIELVWAPQHGVCPVLMDPSQMDQILANLTVNARDAIGSARGRVSIAVRNVVADAAFCAGHAEAVPGEYVALEVADTGIGIAASDLPRIFEPFFTTKDIGRGTGMGLATVYGIVKQNHGFIDVFSEPGHGATFNIYLPRHHPAPARETAGGERRAPVPRGNGESVLLVEDEPAVLQLGTHMLERLGYAVLAAGLPSEALRIAQRKENRIDLLITDVVLPEMTGRELADRIRSLRPEAALLFISGYATDVIGAQKPERESFVFLPKPFSLDGLATAVHGALSRATGAEGARESESGHSASGSVR